MKTNLRVICIFLILMLAMGAVFNLPVFTTTYATNSDGKLALAAESGQSVEFATQAVTIMNAQTANYRAALSDHSRYGFHIAAGEVFEPPDEVFFLLYDLDAPEDDPQWLYVPVEWEIGAYDSNVSGIYPIYITPESSFLKSQIIGFERTRVPLHVVDPNMPYLVSATQNDDTAVGISFYETIGVAREMYLRYSTDGGLSWRNAAADLNADIDLNGATVCNLDPDTVYWFRLEVVGGETAGISNILKVCLDPFATVEPDYATNVQLPPNNGDDVWIDGPVMSAAELRALVSANDGGTATLTGHVVWDNNDVLRSDNPTTVEMGDYGITVPGFGARMRIEGPLHLTGNGVAAPLFTVQSKGELIVHGDASITATGNNATAVKLNANGIISCDNHMLISVTGNNSTAIRADGDAALEKMTVQASGEGSFGVRAAGDVRVFYSDITGDTSIVSQTGRIVLDCAAVHPLPTNAVVINRTAVPYTNYELERYGFCVEPGEALNLPEELIFPLFDEDDAKNIDDIIALPDLTFPVQWAVPDYDPNVLGEHKLYFTPQEPRIPIKGIERTEIPLFIVDPSVPRLTHALRMGPHSFILAFFREIEEAESLRLLYSIDEGKSWADANEDFAGIVTNTAAGVDGLDKDAVYWFKLEVIGGPMAGTSNVLKVWYSPLMDGGGQRDGTGQNGGALPPPIGGNPKKPDVQPNISSRSSVNETSLPEPDNAFEKDEETQNVVTAEEARTHLQPDAPKKVADHASASAETADALPAEADVPEAKAAEPPEAMNTHAILPAKASASDAQAVPEQEAPAYPVLPFLIASVALAGGSILIGRIRR